MAIRKRNSDSESSQPQSLRDVRVEQRRNYTDAAASKGADQEGIARGTNKVYNELFGAKPAGKRDDWTEDQQKRIAVGENFAANRIRDLPTPDEGSSQAVANQRVIDASGQGARAANDYIEDKKENGNWWSNLF